MFLSRFFKPKIGKLLAEKDFNSLLEATYHKNPEVRIEAVEALAEIEKDSEEELKLKIRLYELLSDDEFIVVDSSLKAIAKINPNLEKILLYFNNIDLTLYVSRDEDETIKLKDKDLNIKFSSLTIKSSDLDTFSSLAKLYSKNNEFKKSEFYFKKSLFICLTLYGENNEETAELYHELADMYLKRKDKPFAMDFYKKELDILYNIYNPYHPFVKELNSYIESLS